MRRSRRVVAALGAFAVVAAAAPAIALSGAGSVMASDRASEGPPIDWKRCPDSNNPQVRCGTLRVPLDHDRPNGRQLTLALERRAADDQDNKIGSLFVNPGGPGGSGRNFARAAVGIFGKRVASRFDVIGFDPRGISQSTGIQCFDSNQDYEDVFASIVGVPLSKAEIAKQRKATATYSEACGERAGPVLEHMSTLNVAKDLELMRHAVGDPKLNYVGYSYGTLIGATYANLYPDKMRALILDGPVDPQKRTNDRMANKFDRAGGFETALRGFLSECETAGKACSFDKGKLTPRQKFDRLRERLRQGPIPVNGGQVTISDFTSYAGGAMYSVGSFVPLANELQNVYVVAFGPADERAEAARRIDQLTKERTGPLPDAYSYNGTDALYGVNCSDAPTPRTPNRYAKFANDFEEAHRTFGRSEAFSDLTCATWPVVTDERYTGPWDAQTSAKLLVIGTTYDPATPYTMATNMARDLGNARLLSIDGYGHASQASRCAFDATAAYLLEQELPAPGARCAQDAGPFDPSTDTSHTVPALGSVWDVPVD